MELTDALLPIVLAAFLFAGSIKGLVGIGLPTASISVVAQVADPRLAISLLLLPGLVANAWQVWRSGNALAIVARIWPFCIVMAVGIWYFARFAAGVSTNTLVLAAGIVIVLFVLTNVFSRPLPLPDRWDGPAQCLAGFVAGVMGGLTSIWSPPIVIYLTARRYAKEDFVGATAVLILAGTAPLLLGYWQAGMFTAHLATWSAVMIVPTLSGFAVGEWLRRRMDGQQFRGVFMLVYFVMGANLIRRALL